MMRGLEAFQTLGQVARDIQGLKTKQSSCLLVLKETVIQLEINVTL
jgi:hypothetical protein